MNSGHTHVTILLVLLVGVVRGCRPDFNHYQVFSDVLSTEVVVYSASARRPHSLLVPHRLEYGSCTGRKDYVQMFAHFIDTQSHRVVHTEQVTEQLGKAGLSVWLGTRRHNMFRHVQQSYDQVNITIRCAPGGLCEKAFVAVKMGCHRVPLDRRSVVLQWVFLSLILVAGAGWRVGCVHKNRKKELLFAQMKNRRIKFVSELRFVPEEEAPLWQAPPAVYNFAAALREYEELQLSAIKITKGDHELSYEKVSNRQKAIKKSFASNLAPVHRKDADAIFGAFELLLLLVRKLQHENIYKSSLASAEHQTRIADNFVTRIRNIRAHEKIIPDDRDLPSEAQLPNEVAATARTFAEKEIKFVLDWRRRYWPSPWFIFRRWSKWLFWLSVAVFVFVVVPLRAVAIRQCHRLVL